MRSNLIFALLSLELISCSSCSSPRVRRSEEQSLPLTGRLEAFSEIALGESTLDLKRKLGEPSSTDTEKYGNSEFKTLEFNSPAGDPLAFFTSDSHGRIIGQSIWIDKNQKAADSAWLVNSHFANLHFETFIPCETYGPQKFLVNADQGLFIGVQETRVLFISKSDPELTKLRVSQFNAKCPQLQKSKEQHQ